MSFIKSLITGSGSGATSHVDFDDFSVDVGSDAYSQYAPALLEAKSAPVAPAPKPKAVMKGTGDQQMMSRAYYGEHKAVARAGKSFYDTVSDPKKEPSAWDYILKGEQMRRLSFAALDGDGDGYLTEHELKKVLGNAEDVKRLISIADKNGDGRIDYKEFCDLLRAKEPQNKRTSIDQA